MVLDSVATSCIGWPLPAFAIRSFDNAKVQHFSCDSKYEAV